MQDWRQEFRVWRDSLDPEKAGTTWLPGGLDEPKWAKTRRQSRLSGPWGEAYEGWIDQARWWLDDGNQAHATVLQAVFEDKNLERFWAPLRKAAIKHVNHLTGDPVASDRYVGRFMTSLFEVLAFHGDPAGAAPVSDGEKREQLDRVIKSSRRLAAAIQLATNGRGWSLMDMLLDADFESSDHIHWSAVIADADTELHEFLATPLPHLLRQLSDYAQGKFPVYRQTYRNRDLRKREMETALCGVLTEFTGRPFDAFVAEVSNHVFSHGKENCYTVRDRRRKRVKKK